MGFAPLSRFWRSADGWVRAHANYPWHHAALLQALDADDTTESVGAAMAARTAQEIEAAVFAAGGVAAAVGAAEQWRRHPQGQAIASEPLVWHEVVGPAPARDRDASDLPAEGVRVLDLTRVIAGPVCTRYLAALGADVLRIDPPHRPDMTHGVVADTLLGKRSAIVDARTEQGATTLRDLAASADVVVCGYRPGALEQLGLDPLTLAERNPGVAVVALDAWGHTGPWRGRRGFDSVVQAPTGIAVAEAGGRDEPGSLPCQLLDHGTGYLAAAAVLDSLRRQAVEGGSHVRRLSLARTAAWLVAAPAIEREQTSDDDRQWTVELPFDDGAVIAVRPPGELSGKPLVWPSTPSRYGSSAPHWNG
jgi:crotonobetainyl-CoA:carnitine CoA-transferase CaiB-like acyl-CoA transferase